MQPKLTFTERVMLRNQYEILKHLDQGGKDHYDKLIAIVENGYEKEYGQIAAGISDEGIDMDGTAEVIDILEMYAGLQASFKQLQDKTGIDESNVAFPGFDGNDATEADYMGYTRFLVSDRRFAHVKLRDENGDYNSHMPYLRNYREMLERWKKLPAGIKPGQRHQMSKQQISEVLGRR